MLRNLMLLVIAVSVITVPTLVYAQPSIVNPPAPGSCWGLWGVTVDNGQYLLIHVLSNNYSLYVFNPNQYSTWSSGGQALAIYASQVVAGGTYLIQLPQGVYDVVLYPTPCGVNASAVVKVVNQPAVGIAALGPITTNYVLAYINATGTSPTNPIYVVLGSMVVVSGLGYTREYWVESSVRLGGDAQLMINIINITNTPPTTAYSRVLDLGLINQPTALYLAVKTNTDGETASVLIGYSVIQNGSLYNPPGITWLSHQLAGNAYEAVIEMNPYLAAGGYVYDAELVVGQGYASASPISVELALLYWDGASFKPVVNLYNYALNTEVSSTYLTTSVCQGLPCVVPGQPSYGVLGPFNASNVPMTYLVVMMPNGYSVTRYITEPVNITYPVTLTPTPGTRLVLIGINATINDFSEFVNSSSIVVEPSNEPTTVVVKPVYARYYLVAILSEYSVSVNGTLTSNYEEWVPEGGRLVINASPQYLGRAARAIPTNGTNLVINVDKPLNLTINWVEQYLVNITSQFPISINGTWALNYLGWVNACNYLVINASINYLGNGTRYVPTSGLGTVRVCNPLNITIAWSPQYLVSITSPVPIIINGSLTSNYTAWLSRDSSLALGVPMYYYLGNGTRLVLISPVNGSVTINGPLLIRVVGEPQYLVTIVSPVPILINGTRSSNYTAWVWRGGVVRLSVPKYLVLPNLTLLVLRGAVINGHHYKVGSGIVVVDAPMSITIMYSRYYTLYLAIAFVALLLTVLLAPRFRGGGSGGNVVVEEDVIR